MTTQVIAGRSAGNLPPVPWVGPENVATGLPVLCLVPDAGLLTRSFSVRIARRLLSYDLDYPRKTQN